MRAHEPEGNIVQRRPTETATGVAGSFAVLICALLDVDDPTIILAVAAVVAWLPVAVTFAVNLRR